MMDISAWKFEDDVWVEKRQKDWPVFLEKVNKYIPEDGSADEYVRRAEDYYFKGIVDGRYERVG